MFRPLAHSILATQLLACAPVQDEYKNADDFSLSMSHGQFTSDTSPAESADVELSREEILAACDISDLDCYGDENCLSAKVASKELRLSWQEARGRWQFNYDYPFFTEIQERSCMGGRMEFEQILS